MLKPRPNSATAIACVKRIGCGSIKRSTASTSVSSAIAISSAPLANAASACTLPVPKRKRPGGCVRTYQKAAAATDSAPTCANLWKPSASSDSEPVIGELEQVTDGDKKGAEGSFVELGPGVQHVTVDLGAPHEVFAVLFWHFHKTPRVYFDVVVQLADDADFKTNVRTIFNNDHDNTAGLGAGKDMNFVETSEGKLVDAKGAKARFVRLYSRGNNANELNHFVEVEVFGRPAK